MLLQLSGGLTGLLIGGLLGSIGEAPYRDTTDEPLDWFRNLVPDNLLQAFVFAVRLGLLWEVAPSSWWGARHADAEPP